jgi:hypothetical protein
MTNYNPAGPNLAGIIVSPIAGIKQETRPQIYRYPRKLPRIWVGTDVTPTNDNDDELWEHSSEDIFSLGGFFPDG